MSESSGQVRRGLPRPGGPAASTGSDPAPVEPVLAPAERAAALPAPATAKRNVATAAKRRAITMVLVVAGLVAVSAVAILGARWLMSVDAVSGFIARYPGEYELPESAPVGIPGWLGWQHFFNVFLLVLIIRSGIRIRREQRPTVFWTSRRPAARKISLIAWLHQSLDLLWIINGVIFVVLLFATGQWMRIVPTSWEVFPNAVSALLQYVSFDWPTENGWANYNSLQQLAYFTTVFIAAPISVLTGIRMSEWWPTKVETLNRLYPVGVARTIHFPVMIYFVGFIVAHVALVLLTGALRNLNHMYASRDVADWVGLVVFLVSLVVIAGAWFAVRPLVLAPVAKIFGKVGR
jgi:thiosulfate reductase cytochrome b subunit